MGKIVVEFETITPIYTGDAWGKNSEIKASSVMGSLRFWFEVYCHFAGIEVKENEELKDKDYQKILKNLKKDIDDGENIDDIDKYIFDKLPLTLSSKIFGCTGWKSRIEIEKIEFKENKKYPYPINGIRFQNLEYYSKRRQKNITPSWYFPKGFYGKITITFKTTETIKNSILLPLLNFIEEYAFIGAKNNIGYGRVRFTNIDKVDIFGFEQFGEKNSNIHELVKEKKLVTNNSNNSNDLEELIKGLIEQKANMRRNIKSVKQRHYVFGAIERNKRFDNNATKIIPLISKNKNGSYSGKFLFIVEIKNFGAKK